MQGANLHIGGGWGFSVVLKDTLTHGQEVCICILCVCVTVVTTLAGLGPAP